MAASLDHAVNCTSRLHRGRTCADCMSADHGQSGQAFLMCVAQGYDCHCSTPDTTVPHRRILQRGLGRAAWKRGDDAHAAYKRLLSHQIYAPSALRASPDPGQGGGSWIIQYDNFTTPDEAHALIAAATRSGWNRGNGGKDSASRTNDVAWCRDDCYREPLVERVLRKIEQVTGVDRVHYEALQLLKYRPGEFFRRHHDSYDGAFGAQAMGHRIMTAFMYLNDVPEGGGGETRFTDLEHTPAVAPRLGRMIVWPNVWTMEPTSHDHRMMHEACPTTKGLKYGANVWIHMYPTRHDPNFPTPPLCDMYAHVPECVGNGFARMRRERARRQPAVRLRARGHGVGSLGNWSSQVANQEGYRCMAHRDLRASCIRDGGVGCPFRQVSSLAQCRALCDEYAGQCATFVHNRYGECYLRAESAGAGVADERRHRTASCWRVAAW